MTEPRVLQTLLDEYPVTRAIHDGTVSSPLIRFAFAPYKPANNGFKPMVREMAFDAGELAIITFLMARALDRPLVLLPATISGRFQHHCIAYNSDKGTLSPADLAGRRIGVRAYSQTTGAWVRGILQNEYGVDLSSVTWVTFEDPHVQGFAEPSNVVRGEPGQKLKEMLLDGSLDAAMLGSDMPDDPRLKTVIPDPMVAAQAWHDRTGVTPINHMFVVRQDLSRDRPDIVRDLFRMLKESKVAAGLKGPDMRPYGVAALRTSLETAILYAEQQGLLARRLTVDELFDDVTRVLV